MIATLPIHIFVAYEFIPPQPIPSFACIQPLAALRAANMRLILFQAVVLAFASCAAAQRPKNIQVPPHAGINQFPAGPIVPNFPYAVPFYQAPPVPANSYRGTYVSGVPLWTSSSSFAP